jgi:hypothetical protein
MADATYKLSEYLTMEALARKVGMGRARVRALVVASRIGIQWGGSKEHPHLRARLEDFERVMLSRVVAPPESPDAPRRQVTRPPKPSRNLHPLVNC